MQVKLRKGWMLAILPALVLTANTAFAAGGTVKFITDDGADGYYYSLGGSGVDRFIGEYFAGDFDPGSVICGARVLELNQGLPPFGTMGGDLRAEDPGNPGYPDLGAGGLIAVVDPSSQSVCNTGGGPPRMFTFGGGGGVPDVVVNKYISAIEPVHGSIGTLDFCGVLLDTSSPPQGRSKYFSGGVWGSLPWNHFVELIVFTSKRMDLNIRGGGSARFPGDTGIAVVYTTRGNAGAGVTDDCVSLKLVIDNGTGGPISRNVNICADQTPLGKGLKDVTGIFRPISGGGPIVNPVSIPPGRTVLCLAVTTNATKTKAAGVINKKGSLNLPFLVIVDDPSVDTGPCTREGSADVDDESTTIGFRQSAGKQDDGDGPTGTDAFFARVGGVLAGDVESVRHRAIDLPQVTYSVSGFQVVLGEFPVTPSLPGIGLELRPEDPVFTDSPDLAAPAVRSASGVKGGTPPTVVTVNIPDLSVDPTASSGVSNWYTVAVLNPGDFVGGAPGTATGSDQTPGTLLGNSSRNFSSVQPSDYDPTINLQIRLLTDGADSTLPERFETDPNPNAFLREVGRFIAIDKDGRRIQ